MDSTSGRYEFEQSATEPEKPSGTLPTNGHLPTAAFAGDSAFLAAIVDSSEDAIISKDLDGRIQTWNAGAERLFGYSAAEVIGRPVSILALPELHNEMPEILDRIRRGERVEHYETSRRRKDGSRIYVSLTVSPIRGPDGAVVGASKIARDITARRRAEDVLEAQGRILQMVASGAGLGQVLSALCEAVEKQLTGAKCAILLYRPETGRLHLGAAPNLPDFYRAAVDDGVAVGPMAGSCGTAVHRREAVIVADIASDPLWADAKDLALRAGLRACWSRPIVSDSGEVLGTFATYFDTLREPDRIEHDAINSWLHLASIAVRRLQAVEALATSEERLRLAQQAAEIGSWSLDLLDPRRNFWSAESYRIAALDPSWQPDYDEWLARVHPDDRDRVNNEIQRALAGGPAFQTTYRFIGGDGRERWHEARGNVRRDSDGKPLAANGITLDITDRKEAERALRESEQTRELITDSLPVLISYVDAEERYRFNNKTYESWFGVSRAQVQGRTVLEVLGEAAYALVAPRVKGALRGEHQSFETLLPFPYPTGRHVHATYVPDVDRSGEVCGFFALIEDITERVRMERSLRESEERYRFLADAMPQFVWTRDASGLINYVNKHFIEYSGTTYEQARSGEWLEVVHPEDRTRFHEAAVQRSQGEEFEFECRFRRVSDGAYRWHVARECCVRDATGETRWIGTAADIEDRKRAEEELRHTAQRFQLALRNAPVSVFEQDRELRYTWAHNESDIFRPELLLGKTDEELNPGPWLQNLVAVKHRILTTGVGERHEFTIPAAGEDLVYDMTLDPLLDRDGNITGISAAAVNITGRKKTEHELRAREEQWRFLANVLPQFIWVADLEGRTQFLNRYWFEYTGLPEDSDSGQNWAQAVHPDDIAPTYAAWQEASRTGHETSFEYRVRRVADGLWRWHLGIQKPERDASGNVQRWVGVGIDIHDRREAESRSQLLGQAGVLLVSSLDPHQTLRTVAKLAVPSFADWSAVDLLAPDGTLTRVAVEHTDSARIAFAHELHKRYPPRETDATLQAVRTGQSFFIEHIPDALIDERAHDAEHARLIRQLGLKSFIAAPMLAPDRVLGVLTFATAESGRPYTQADVQFAEELARRAALAIDNSRLYSEVQARESWFRELANALPAFVWTTDTDGLVTFFNDRWYAYTGLTPDQSLGAGWLRTLPVEDVDRISSVWEDARRREVPYQVESRYRGVNGEFRWFMARALPVRNDSGQIVQWFGTSTDVHDAKLTEDELRRANAELEEFAYVSSHDLREPLRMISLYTQMLLRSPQPADDKAATFGGFIRQGVVRMEQLIEDLLSYSRVIHNDGLPAGNADLSVALAQALDILKNEIDETGAVITAAPMPKVRGDAGQLSHVFQNLLSNAIKYRHAEKRPVIDIAARQHGEQWIISVKDQGIGFDPQYSERIFGLFKRLYKDEYPGTGLGLAICKRIVERYGGRIWAEAQLGHGASFYFTLPSALTETQVASEVRSDNSSPGTHYST